MPHTMAPFADSSPPLSQWATIQNQAHEPSPVQNLPLRAVIWLQPPPFITAGSPRKTLTVRVGFDGGP